MQRLAALLLGSGLPSAASGGLKGRRNQAAAVGSWGVPPDQSDHSRLHCGKHLHVEEILTQAQRRPMQAGIRSAIQPCVNGMSAGLYDCNATDLLSYMPLADFGQTVANDIWGWTDPETGKEYAIMGVLEGTVFVDVSDPVNPQALVYVKSHGSSSLWRDIKVYNDRAYIVSEASNHGMQIYDLTRLRCGSDSLTEHIADIVYTGFGSAHNMVINEESGRAYAVGGDKCWGGMHIMNITELAPQYLACGNREFTHDAHCVVYRGPDTEHVGKEICVTFYQHKIDIIDFTDADHPVRLSTTTYPHSLETATHQGWFDEEHAWIYANDELDEYYDYTPKTKTLIFNATDLDNVEFASTFLHSTHAIDHNLYIHNGHVYEANYCEGMRILRIEPDHMLSEVAYFDTEPQCNDHAAMEGLWSVYPYFRSGTIIASDIGRGLFVLRASGLTPAPTTPGPPAPAPTPCRPPLNETWYVSLAWSTHGRGLMHALVLGALAVRFI